MDPIALAILGIAGLVALSGKARPQSPAAVATGPAPGPCGAGPRFVSEGGVAVYPCSPAPVSDADRARQLAEFEAAARAREQAQLNQAAGALNNVVPGAGTVVKAIANVAEALGLSSPVYHFPANFDPYDWIATHHFDVLAVSVHGVLEANRQWGDQGPGMGVVHGDPETPLQGFWLEHSEIGNLGPGDHNVDQVRAALPAAPPRGFGNPLPIPGATTWQDVARNIGEFPPPPPVDRNSVSGPDFAKDVLLKVVNETRLQDWRAAGGGKPAELRHPEQLYAKYPELAPAAAAPAAAAPAPSGVFGLIGQALAAAAAAAAPAPSSTPTTTTTPTGGGGGGGTSTTRTFLN